MCINIVLLCFLQMTALESADEIEAVTAITFLLSLVIKRYMYCMFRNLKQWCYMHVQYSRTLFNYIY